MKIDILVVDQLNIGLKFWCHLSKLAHLHGPEHSLFCNFLIVLELILQEVPQFETYTRLQLTGAYLAMQKRVNALISQSVEERYLGFLQLYPDIVQRVPQHMIASYMGLSPETLSRVRKKISLTGKT